MAAADALPPSDVLMSPTLIVGYLALFTLAGFLFLFVNLLVGRFLRPAAPNVEKLEVYECGEPTIGTSFVQFDLRFYVVALLFIIFDVEVAFFFPWATVFGKATHLMDPQVAVVADKAADGKPLDRPRLTPAAAAVLGDLGVTNPDVADATASLADNAARLRQTSQRLALASIADILVFFAVLMVGFAYVWMRGDLDWVRAVGQQRAAAARGPSAAIEEDEPALVG